MTPRWIAVAAIASLIGLVGCPSLSRRDVAVSSPPPVPMGVEAGSGPEAQADDPRTNTLRWTTASEVDNFGFDVYRGDREDGPFERLTRRPVAGAGTADVPTDYAYVDETIDPTREYFYYVESISMSGERQRFTPIMRAPAKR